MNLLEIALDKITDHLPGRHLGRKGSKQLYVERFHLCRIPLTKWSIYIHRVLNSDYAEEGLHDHPWDYGFSIILVGWYIEQFLDGFGNIRHRNVKWFNWITGHKIHLLKKPDSLKKPIWTLMVRGGAKKTWGFVTVNSKENTGYVMKYYEGGPSDINWFKTAIIGKELKEKNKTTKYDIYK
jgi:hypothetical protein